MDHGSLFSCVENANLNIKEKRKHKFLCTHHFVNRHWFVNLLQDKYLVFFTVNAFSSGQTPPSIYVLG